MNDFNVLKAAPVPTWAILSGTLALAVFSALPAWRPQIFGTNYVSYYTVRVCLFLLMSLLFFLFANRLNRNLSVGDTASRKTGYGDPLLTLRAFACAVVLVGHGATISFAPADIVRQAAESKTFWLLFPLPWAGVWIFFTLSGYLMGKGFFTGRYQFNQADILRFYRNRFLRIAPLAYFAIAIIVLFQRPDAFSAANLKHLVALLLFDYDGTSPLSLIGLLWSIATEMQFYLLAPFMAYVIFTGTRRYGVAAIAVPLLAFGTAYRLGCFNLSAGASWTVSVYTPLFGNLDLFGLGMLTSYVVQRYPVQWPRIIHGLIAMGLIWIAGALLWSKIIVDAAKWVVLVQYYTPPLFCIATIATVWLFENAVRSGVQPSAPVRRWIQGTQIFGTLTYAIYLWHAPIFQAYAKTVAKPVMANDTMLALAISTASVVAFSWVTYRMIEQPIDAMRSSRT